MLCVVVCFAVLHFTLVCCLTLSCPSLPCTPIHLLACYSLYLNPYFSTKHLHDKSIISTGGSRSTSPAFSSGPSYAYHKNLTQHLYRNSLFARLNLPHRYTAILCVDIFGLKEVGAGPCVCVYLCVCVHVYVCVRLYV
jgi:hypothetical protein